MNCNYRYCGKEIKYGRPDRKFCNKNCKSKERAIEKEFNALNRKNKNSHVHYSRKRKRRLKFRTYTQV